MNIPGLVLLSIATCMGTAMYFLLMERDTYRCSWRVHLCGILLPIILMYICRHPVVWSIALSFATFHLTSILSEQQK